MDPTYTSFETLENFLCSPEHKAMLERIQVLQPELFENLLFMCHEKQELSGNPVVVKIYADNSTGKECPKICKDWDTFSKLRKFEVYNNVVPTVVANRRWIHENVSIVGY